MTSVDELRVELAGISIESEPSRALEVLQKISTLIDAPQPGLCYLQAVAYVVQSDYNAAHELLVQELAINPAFEPAMSLKAQLGAVVGIPNHSNEPERPPFHDPSWRTFDHGQEFVGEACPLPFNYCEMTDTGDVLMCCYLDRNIGNMKNRSFNEVWNSQFAQAMRQSMVDGSFRYCDKQKCARMQNHDLWKIGELKDPYFHETITQKRTALSRGPEIVALMNDATCNLSCPSCRVGPYTMPKDQLEAARVMQAEIFNSIKRDLKVLHVSGNGDPFASRLHRELLQGITPEEYPGVKIRIQTNGQLIKRYWPTLERIHDRIERIGISADAASPEVYKEVRPGGTFENLVENLEFISTLPQRKNGLIMGIAMVVQKANFRDMKGLVELGLRTNMDSISYASLSNWGTFTAEQYQDKSVCSPDNPLHAELLEILRDPIFDHPKVYLGNLQDLRAIALSH
jgi:MoaA/NifB/PqqE/SkfB family radical SAM enzyme